MLLPHILMEMMSRSYCLSRGFLPNCLHFPQTDLPDRPNCINMAYYMNESYGSPAAGVGQGGDKEKAPLVTPSRRLRVPPSPPPSSVPFSVPKMYLTGSIQTQTYSSAALLLLAGWFCRLVCVLLFI